MLTKSTPVALIVPNQEQVQLFTQALAASGFRRIVSFTSSKEAYEVCTRQQFALFVTRMEMPDLNGIVLIQKLRMTGNYGLEPHLFVCDKIDTGLLSILSEYDLDHVMVPPLTREAIGQKFQHMIAAENSITAHEKSYREAKSAFANQLLEMAEEIVGGVLKESPSLEKALLLLGDIKAAQKKITEAAAIYKKAFVFNPKSAASAHKLAQMMMAQGEHAQAAAMLNRLATISPYSIKLLENAGLSNFNAQAYDKAKEHMSKLTAIDETNKTAGSLTAEIKIKTGDYDGLVDVLRRSHTEKELIQFLNNAGAKLSQGNDIDGALRMYRSAVEQITSNTFLYAIHYNMGLAYKKKKMAAEAKSHLETALRLKPDFAKASEALAELTAAA
jgi:tetratricopeptide (TPR) repeat protein